MRATFYHAVCKKPVVMVVKGLVPFTMTPKITSKTVDLGITELGTVDKTVQMAEQGQQFETAMVCTNCGELHDLDEIVTNCSHCGKSMYITSLFTTATTERVCEDCYQDMVKIASSDDDYRRYNRNDIVLKRPLIESLSTNKIKL